MKNLMNILSYFFLAFPYVKEIKLLVVCLFKICIVWLILVISYCVFKYINFLNLMSLTRYFSLFTSIVVLLPTELLLLLLTKNKEIFIYEGDISPKEIDGTPFKSQNSLTHWWLTGFADAEGCYRISILKNKELNTKWGVRDFFQILLHRRDKAVVDYIQSKLGVGKIYTAGLEAVSFEVHSMKDLKVIISHFDKYPLITQKYADYLLFKMAVNLINNNEHLTIEGLHKIVAIRASMNWGLSDKLKAAFPDIIPVQRPGVLNTKIQNSNWLAGFTDGEGCFIVNIKKSKTIKTGYQILLRFSLPYKHILKRAFDTGEPIPRLLIHPRY